MVSISTGMRTASSPRWMASLLLLWISVLTLPGVCAMAADDENTARRPFIEVPAQRIPVAEQQRIIEPQRFFIPPASGPWGWVTCNDTGEFELRKNPIWRQHCEPVNRLLSR